MGGKLKNEQYICQVCGYNYVIDYANWKALFDDLCV